MTLRIWPTKSIKKHLLAGSENSSQQFDISDMLGLATLMEQYKLAFSKLYCLLCIASVLPVAFSECKCSFPSLELMKMYLRSTTCDWQLSNIAVLSTELKLNPIYTTYGDIVVKHLDFYGSIHTHCVTIQRWTRTLHSAQT